MRKMLAFATAPGLLLLLAHESVFAYDIPNHFDMSTTAVSRSVLGTDATALPNLGLSDLKQQFVATPGYNTSDFTNGCVHSAKFAILNLVGCGAQFEDVPGTRSLNHFFDPVHNAPLTVGGSTRGMTSPDWALKDNNDESSQEFSYKDARNYFYNALTTTGLQATRDALWGKLFQSIGQVVHHVQDMAQPQHVRNDQHVDKPIPGLYNPSLYETYTRQNRDSTVKPLLLLPSAEPVYTTENPNLFKLPRDFWTNSRHSGMADFTNSNFVSAGTNFRMFGGQQVDTTYFASPSPGVAEPVLAANLSPALAPGILTSCARYSLNCTMTFFGSADGRSRAAALSIFDQYLQLRPAQMKRGSITYFVDRQFTLNRYTFDVAHQTLIPRAVSYSAGLINFFFRGKMEISLPDDGIYGVVDHSVEKYADSSGFRQIKLKLKNVTPRGPDIEPMTTGGKLKAVAKFHRNTCYQPDLSGEYGSPGRDWHTCRSKDEFIAVSQEISAPAGINDAAQPLAFTFDSPIPINATDLFLQVVYRGPLGDETDAVAVVTKDISEPTYHYRFDVHDQYTYTHYPAISINGVDATYSWSQWCDQAVTANDVQNSGECGSRLWPTKRAFKFSSTNTPIPGWDPANPPAPMGEWTNFSQEPAFNPLFTLSAPTGSYSRVAYLTDAVPTNRALLVDDWNGPTHLFSWVTGFLPAAKNQVDLTTNTLTPSHTWVPARGIYVSPSDAQLIGTPPAGISLLQPQAVIFSTSP